MPVVDKKKGLVVQLIKETLDGDAGPLLGPKDDTIREVVQLRLPVIKPLNFEEQIISTLSGIAIRLHKANRIAVYRHVLTARDALMAEVDGKLSVRVRRKAKPPYIRLIPNG